jgi:GTP cyclohydrolase II
MKTPVSKSKRAVATLGLVLALAVAGCGDSAQQKAYEQAAKAEQQLTAENASAIVAEYKQAISLKPGSAWAKKAQERIEAVEARVKAEELRKSVFQEHGID